MPTETEQQPPALNPSPKQRFMLSGDNVSKHRKLVDSPEFQRGLDFAALQYQAQLAAQTSNAQDSMAVGFKLQGALEFAQVLRMLSETPRAPSLPSAKGLNHDV